MYYKQLDHILVVLPEEEWFPYLFSILKTKSATSWKKLRQFFFIILFATKIQIEKISTSYLT